MAQDGRVGPVHPLIVRRALAGQPHKQAQKIIDWLEQTVPGWNADPRRLAGMAIATIGMSVLDSID